MSRVVRSFSYTDTVQKKKKNVENVRFKPVVVYITIFWLNFNYQTCFSFNVIRPVYVVLKFVHSF